MVVFLWFSVEILNYILGDIVKFIFSLLIFFGLLLIITIPKPILHELKPKEIDIFVSGEVSIEGKITLANYSTLGDLLALITLTDEAEIQYLNQNQILFHNDKIVIPKKEEIKRISINTAIVSELIQLPGIGTKTAEAIVSYREANGMFQNLEELQHVKGIGTAKYEKLVALICL